MKKIATFLLIGIILVLPLSVKAISTSATSSILMDMDSNRVLYESNPHTIRSIASISKIMTGILAVESGKMEKTVTVDDTVLKAYGSGIYVKPGEKLKLKDLVYGLMLRSGNDAAVMIAKYVGGSVPKFVKLMNQKASEIGMKDTTFNNPSGLDEKEQIGNFSTAYDMALLTSYAMQNEDYQKIVGTKKYTLKTNKNTYVWHNKNKLLNTYQYTTGGKTGFTKKARRTLVSTASKDNLNLVVVTLNDGDDFKDHMNLHDYGFTTYQKYHILKKGTIKIKGEKYYKNERLYIKKDVDYPIRMDEKEGVRLNFELDKKKQLKNNGKVGNVEVKLGEQTVYKVPIYVEKKQAKKKGWFHLW
ncbi:MAG: D-alanyl-D-alanine carboxypeptidase [Firmicutes bacterium]|nr:D-alanyl-D-alanine carboxypeptidase [Bacillota bacterium]